MHHTPNQSKHTVATGGSSTGSRKRGRGGEGVEASSTSAEAPPAKVMVTGVGKEETPKGGEGGAVGGGSPKQQGPGAGAGWNRTKELQERIQEVEEEKRLIEEGAWGFSMCMMYDVCRMHRSGKRSSVSTTHAGSHPEYTHKSDALQRVRDRRVFAAERFKQMQMDNIQGLYEYEVLEAEAGYKVRGRGVGVWVGLPGSNHGIVRRLTD